MLKVVFTFLVLLLETHTVSSAPLNSAQLVDDILDEAKDYLIVKPSQSIDLLSSVQSKYELSPKQEINLNIILIRAALKLHKLALMEDSIMAVLKFETHNEFDKNLPTILSSIGIFMRKSGYLEEAKLCILCALNNANREKVKLGLLVNLAVIYRHMAQYKKSQSVYKDAKYIAKTMLSKKKLAMIENNLGVIALELEDYDLAEQHFRDALPLQQAVSNRSGNILTGLNLLQIFLIKNQNLNFERLSPTIKRLSDASPDIVKKAIFFWLKTTFDQRKGNKVTAEVKEQLQNTFIQIKDRKIQLSLKKHFAQELKVDVKIFPAIHKKVYLKQRLLKLKVCQWDKLKYQTIIEM